MKNKEFFLIALTIFLTIIAWIIADIYYILNTKKTTVVDPQLANPIQVTLDTAIFDVLEKKKQNLRKHSLMIAIQAAQKKDARSITRRSKISRLLKTISSKLRPIKELPPLTMKLHLNSPLPIYWQPHPASVLLLAK